MTRKYQPPSRVEEAVGIEENEENRLKEGIYYVQIAMDNDIYYNYCSKLDGSGKV
jgi:hypothetical protein